MSSTPLIGEFERDPGAAIRVRVCRSPRLELRPVDCVPVNLNRAGDVGYDSRTGEKPRRTLLAMSVSSRSVGQGTKAVRVPSFWVVPDPISCPSRRILRTSVHGRTRLDRCRGEPCRLAPRGTHWDCVDWDWRAPVPHEYRAPRRRLALGRCHALTNRCRPSRGELGPGRPEP